MSIAKLFVVLALLGPACCHAQSLSGYIEPLTRVAADGSGYLADPQPVRLQPGSQASRQLISGTTHALLEGLYPVRPQSFSWSPLVVNAAILRGQIAAAGATLVTIQNTNIFQDNDGCWHAAVGLDVVSPSHPKFWTVTAHARPNGLNCGSTPPQSWTADTVLSGSFQDPVEGNYDAKYYKEDGRLYLLYVRNRVPEPRLRNEIVIQPMASPTRPEGAPSVLLSPGDRFGPLRSENYANTQAKLVEAPWLLRIGGKHALIYSTGAYLTAGYKAGVAWSDTLIPSGPQARYRKVLLPDPRGAWGPERGPEVRYVVQSQNQDWPNFTGATVIGPGVASVVHGADGTWWLYFNGFAPGDMPLKPNGRVDGAHRRPFGLRLAVHVPPDVTVSSASDEELAAWLQPAER